MVSSFTASAGKSPAEPNPLSFIPTPSMPHGPAHETNHEGDEEAVSGASGNASGRGPSVRSRRALDGDLTTRASPAVAAGTANPQSPLR
jgi:hypothetical protein